MRRFVVYIFIVVGFLSCEDIIEVPDISDDTVILIAPTDAVTISSTSSIFFDWDLVEDAESYRIQIARPNFTEAVQILVDSTLAGTSYQTTLDPNGYEWRVRAENSGYETAYTTNSLTVE